MSQVSVHPVWDVYDEFRTARLNVKYHGALVRKCKRADLGMELVLAISAPTSAVTGLWFWQTEVGAIAWKVLAVLAGLTALVKPLLKMSEKVRHAEELLAGYRSLDHDFQRLVYTIRQEKTYNKGMQERFIDLLDKKKELIKNSREAKPNKQLQRECEKEVEVELPVESFYIPKEEQ